MQSNIVEERIADIEQHVRDGLITREEADVKIDGLRAVEKFADGIESYRQKLLS